MNSTEGTRFAQLLIQGFDAMVVEVSGELARAGHPDLTVGNEFAMQAIEDGADDAAGLARRLGVTRQAAAKTITTLEALGYVTRSAHASDARRKELRVTAHGHDAIAIGARAFAEAHARWRRQVGPKVAAATTQGLRELLPHGTQSGTRDSTASN